MRGMTAPARAIPGETAARAESPLKAVSESPENGLTERVVTVVLEAVLLGAIVVFLMAVGGRARAVLDPAPPPLTPPSAVSKAR